MCLQEIKADNFCLKKALRTILPGYQAVTDPPEGTQGGVAILVHPDISIRQEGTLDFGQVAWAQLTAQGEDFGIVNIHAPSDSARARTLLWHILSTQLPDDCCIVCGDFNMVEDQADPTGTASRLQGCKKDIWRILKSRFDLEDACDIAHTISGSRYTQQGTHFGKFIQSQLDQFYISDGGWWIDAIISLVHVPDCALSDQDPVTMHITINKPPQSVSVQQSLYFKANPSVLKRKGVLEILETTWKSHPSHAQDPWVKFSLACDCLQGKYKELQEETKDLDAVFELLKGEVRRLKSELEEGNNPEDVQELLNKITELKKMEEDQAIHWRRLW
jgi:exonuclease III